MTENTKWLRRDQMDDLLVFWNASAVMDDVDEICRNAFKVDVRTGQVAALRQWAETIASMYRHHRRVRRQDRVARRGPRMGR